jgi:hypothetical protein
VRDSGIVNPTTALCTGLLLGVALVAPPGPTLFPDPPRVGETLRFVMPGAIHARPERAADTLSLCDAGDTVTVTREVGEDGGWVAVDAGWVEVARLDRRPAAIPGDLDPGLEGLVGGRILPWDWRPTDLRDLPDSVKAPGFEGKALRLRAPAAEAFVRMVDAARAESLRIAAFSAWRSAAYQRKIVSTAGR